MNYILSHPKILLCLALIETILIIILVLCIVYIARRNKKAIEKERKKHEKIMSDFKKKSEYDVNYWRDAFFKEYEKQDQSHSVQNSHSKQKENNFKNEAVNDTPSTTTNEDFRKFAEKEREKGIVVHEYRNDDGTTKSILEFDLQNEESKPSVPPCHYDYLEAANNGQFRKLLPTDEKSFFSTWEENGIRKFEFHGNVEKALANINAVFDDVCEIEGKQNGATQIINVEPGTLDSKLRVEKKAKIKLA